jgi:hypothetical protein
VKPLPILAAAVVALLVPSVAIAQDNDVNYDPDSPAGKEYGLPLDSARNVGGGGDVASRATPRSAKGGSAASTASQSSGVLFGVGIAAKPGGKERNNASRGSETSRGSKKQAAGHEPSTPAAVSRERRNFKQTVAASSGASPIMIGGGFAGLALVAALLGLLAVRRFRGSRSAG